MHVTCPSHHLLSPPGDAPAEARQRHAPGRRLRRRVLMTCIASVAGLSLTACTSGGLDADGVASPGTSRVVAAAAPPVRLTEVEYAGVGAFRIEMPMGTVYFEKDNGVSGFKSFFDPAGADWIASYLEPGPNGEFRGFPNSVGNFGHAGRDSGSTTHVVEGRTEGEFVILESANDSFTFQYWFFATHVAIKVLKSTGDYTFLFEGVAGGTADAADYFVTADGERHIPNGRFRDFTPEWLYLGDPTSNYFLFLGKTPDDDAPNENHRQIRPNGMHNMDLYSFGRAGIEDRYAIRGMSGNEHVAIIGFAPADTSHGDMARMIEGILASPFEPYNP